jgi:hypothetical protein
MKMSRIAISAWVGFVAYSLLMFLAGPAGDSRATALRAQRDQMLANIEKLGRLNGSLNDRIETLKRDPDAIALEARKLGYLSGNETLVRIPGGVADQKFSNVGSVVKFSEKEWAWGIYYKAIGALAAAACWISLETAERNSRNGGKKRRFELRGGGIRTS